MRKNLLEKAVAKGLSTRKIARKFNTSQTNARYWLQKYELKTCPKKAQRTKCPVCGKEESGWLCKSCRTKIRRYRTKLAAVKMLGGKCVRCGWRGDLAGFEFHHVKGRKDMTIGAVANRAWGVVKKELLKCILLCSTCHRIEHSTRSDPKLIAAAKRYKGTLLDIGIGS